MAKGVKIMKYFERIQVQVENIQKDIRRNNKAIEEARTNFKKTKDARYLYHLGKLEESEIKLGLENISMRNSLRMQGFDFGMIFEKKVCENRDFVIWLNMMNERVSK